MEKAYRIQHTKEYDESVLEAIVELDDLAYTEKQEKDLEKKRTMFKNVPGSFLLLYYGEEIVGYFNFYPIKKSVREKIVNDAEHPNPNISLEDLSSYRRWKSHAIFINSIVVHPDHRGAPAKRLLNHFYDLIMNMHDKGYVVEELLAFADSQKGASILLNYGFNEQKTVDENARFYYATFDDFKVQREMRAQLSPA